MPRLHPPEVMDYAMKVWASQNRPPDAEIARAIQRYYNVKVAPNTIKAWRERGQPINWYDFEARYKAKLYAGEAERLAQESAEVREQTWVALRSMLEKLGDDMARFKRGEIALDYRSAEGLIRVYLDVVKTYFSFFGKNEELIANLLKAAPEEVRVHLREQIESGKEVEA